MVSYRKMLPSFKWWWQLVFPNARNSVHLWVPMLASRQSAHSLNRIFYFTGRNSFLGGGGRVKEGVKRWSNPFHLICDRGKVWGRKQQAVSSRYQNQETSHMLVLWVVHINSPMVKLLILAHLHPLHYLRQATLLLWDWMAAGRATEASLRRHRPPGHYREQLLEV